MQAISPIHAIIEYLFVQWYADALATHAINEIITVWRRIFFQGWQTFKPFYIKINERLTLACKGLQFRKTFKLVHVGSLIKNVNSKNIELPQDASESKA